MSASIFDSRPCKLGEGPLWHPTRKQLFWFDILSKRLMTRRYNETYHWQFDEYVSAAGWVDDDTLLIATQTGLRKFDIASGDHDLICDLEADNFITRSNDGRADPWGGFWIGTMGINAENSAGAIYRFFEGKICKIFDRITISNSICFSADRQYAYYCDTTEKQIMRVELNPSNGWIDGDPSVFVDLTAEGLNPDGAVVDAQGCLWNAQWGASRVARYAPDGTFMSAVSVPAVQPSCPAFGGDDLKTLYVTTAADGLTSAGEGQTYAIQTPVVGQQEHQIIL